MAGIVLLAGFGFGLYRYHWHGGVTRLITTILPYPAALVEGRLILYADYQNDLTTLQHFYDAERPRAAPGSIFPSEAELQTRVLDRLIKDRLALAAAARYGIVVTSSQVRDAYRQTVLDQAALPAAGGGGAETQAADTLERLYGLQPAEFKSRVLYPFLVRQRLEQAIRNDEVLNAQKKKKAETALEELKAGKPFKSVALAYSEDANVAATGGERGLIGRGLLPPEVEAAAFALKPGETSGIVKSALGYHVLRVLDRQMANGQVAKVKLQEILIRPIRLDEYLEAQKKTASVTVFVH